MKTTKKKVQTKSKAKPTKAESQSKSAETESQVIATQTVSKSTVSKESKPDKRGIKKEYIKSRNVCKVTFRLPRIAAPEAKSVCIVGEFNNWNIYASPMNKLQNGDFEITIELEPGREYHFRYLIDGTSWENDWNADKYVKSPYGDSDNSVVVV